MKPNVIIVLTDDQGYGDLSCHGNPVLRTPCLDQLYNESVRFTDFHVSPVCSPTRSALMTGLDPVLAGIRSTCGVRSILREGEPTLADIFRGHGYCTGQFGKWHLGGNYPFRPEDRGFDDSFYFRGWDLSTVAAFWNSQCLDDVYLRNGRPEKATGYCTDVWFREAMQWMLSCHQEENPFFAYIATNAPHWPWYVPDEYRAPYSHLPHLLASFFGMIANLDENIGRLNSMLEESGLKNNTILIYMTDNGTAKGEEIFNAGMRGKKGSLCEGGHRVPCFMRWPSAGIQGGKDIDALSAHIDIMPTLADLCGFTIREDDRREGISLAPLLRGESLSTGHTGRCIVVQSCPGEVPVKGKGTVMSEKWRLVDGMELYDVQTDPQQQENILENHPDVADRLRKVYDHYWEDIATTFGYVARIRVGSIQEPVTELNCFDWHSSQGEIVIGQNSIREGKKGNGCWELWVEKEGEYVISVRRWPVELDVAIADGVPAFQPFDARYSKLSTGIPLPITVIRIEINGVRMEKSVIYGDRETVFHVFLAEGETILRAGFYDDEGKELTAAYYASVYRLTKMAESMI